MSFVGNEDDVIERSGGGFKLGGGPVEVVGEGFDTAADTGGAVELGEAHTTELGENLTVQSSDNNIGSPVLAGDFTDVDQCAGWRRGGNGDAIDMCGHTEDRGSVENGGTNGGGGIQDTSP